MFAVTSHKLKEFVLDAVKALSILEPPNVLISQATDPRFGDYQTNIAMVLAKMQKSNPRALATEIVEQLNRNPEFLKISEPAEIAGAGFINFRLTPTFLSQQIIQLLQDPTRLGVAPTSTPTHIVVDYGGPNIAKPMHVGHLRATILGDAFVRIARFLGHKVTGDNHLGDWGTQFGRVIFGWKNFLNKDALAKNPLEELVSIYQLANVPKEPSAVAQQIEKWKARLAQTSNESALFDLIMPELLDKASTGDAAAIEQLTSIVNNACRAELVKLQSDDPTNLEIWKQCVSHSRVELDKTYAEFNVHFDLQLGESFYHQQLAPLVEDLLSKGVAEFSEGAVMIFFRDNPRLQDKPAMIRKSDGGFNYTTTDLATVQYRVGTLHADRIWYVVGSPQALHFEQLGAACAKMGLNVPIEHIPFGSILGEDRKIMRTRSGENVALRDLIDEAQSRAYSLVNAKNPDLPESEKKEIARVIGLGAIKYADLSQYRMTDYIFNWEKMLSFQGNTAPYLQNAYVRIQSIFRKFDPQQTTKTRLEFLQQKISTQALELSEPAELNLAKKLTQFAETVPLILDEFRPNILANYLYELAGSFHLFFESCPVLKSEGATQLARLTLCAITAEVLEKGLDLLGIEVPNRM